MKLVEKALELVIRVIDAPSAPVTKTRRARSVVPRETSDQSREALVKTVEAMAPLRKEELAVIGSYCRHDEHVRSQLKQRTAQLIAGCQETAKTRENYLLWGSPGSGKSFMVEQVAAAVQPAVSFMSINIAKDSDSEVCSKLSGLEQSPVPALVLVDEIDARADEVWPYQRVFPYLDHNLQSNLRRVFVLAGSAPGGLSSMAEQIILRPKGKDLLDRIPQDRRFEIPAMSTGDRAAIFASNVRDAALEQGLEVRELERLAVFYLLLSEGLSSARQVRELAFSAVRQIGKAQDRANDRLYFDDLFRRGRSDGHDFRRAHAAAVGRLSDHWIPI